MNSMQKYSCKVIFILLKTLIIPCISFVLVFIFHFLVPVLQLNCSDLFFCKKCMTAIIFQKQECSSAIYLSEIARNWLLQFSLHRTASNSKIKTNIVLVLHSEFSVDIFFHVITQQILDTLPFCKDLRQVIKIIFSNLSF